MANILQNRTQAGQLLAIDLTEYVNRSDVLVLALPRGGVPVAFEIAKKLNLPLDVCLVRKLGVPKRKELAMGAIGSGGVKIINQDIINWLNIPEDIIDEVTAQEQIELERRDRLYRENRPFPLLENQTIILVDDGIATGSTLRAAIATIKQHHPQKIIIAVPVAPPEICQQLKSEVDEVVCYLQPDPLHSISLWYENFSQTSDQEVRDLLAIAKDNLTAV